MTLRQRVYLMLRRRSAYRSAFIGPDGQPNDACQAVLADLTKFCRARESTAVVSRVTGSVDTHASMLAEGRREVFNRITHYLNLTEAQVHQLLERENERE